MNISAELYYVFYQVAKHQSFSRAAEALFISQSAVSQSVKNLEQRLGFPLLRRTTKSVQLTLDGSMLYTHLAQAFPLIESAEEKLRARQDPYLGQITIAATDTLCKYVLLPKIEESTRTYPNLRIKIINGTSYECLTLVKESACDFALINLPNDHDPALQILKRYPFTDVFIAQEDADIPEPITLAEIAQQPLLVLDQQSMTRRVMNALFAAHQIAVQPDIELQNINLLIDMAEMGLGISFVPDLYVKDRKVRILQTVEAVPQRSFGIVALSALPLSPAAETFLALL